jgi:hypothetical protein
MQMNSVEPAGVSRFTHTALRQTVDLQYFVVSKTILTELKVPVVPFDWLLEVVRNRGCDHLDPHAVKLRKWVKMVCDRNQLLQPLGGRRNEGSSYVSSPSAENGNPSEPAECLLRVPDASGTKESVIAASLLKNMRAFYQASNIDLEVRNLLPALKIHCGKRPDFTAMFDCAPVGNVTFLLGLFHTDSELRAMPSGLFTPVVDDKPATGSLVRQEKAPDREDGGWTAYGMHIGVAIILSSFMGGDETPYTPECTTVVASKIMSQLLQQAPTSVVHPSGTHLQLRGFTSKAIRVCAMDVPVRKNRVQAAFFHRPINDNSLLKPKPSMSMMDTPLHPYMYEDCVHLQYIEYLKKSHGGLLERWNEACVLHGADVDERKVYVNSVLKDVGLSDLYRSLDPPKLPCDDTLVYGVYYPVVGAGVPHTCDNGAWQTVTGHVIMHDALRSDIFIFRSEPVHYDEPMREFNADGDNPKP